MTPATGPAILPHETAVMHEGAALVATNPFSEAWVQIARRLLGAPRPGGRRVVCWVGGTVPVQGLARVMEIIRPVLADVCRRLRAGAPATGEEIDLYVKVALLVLYDAFEPELQHAGDTGVLRDRVHRDFDRMRSLLFDLPGRAFDVPAADVLLAVFYQIRRAFAAIHTTILGVSRVSGQLRAAVWNEIFAGGDLLTYARWKHAHMDGTSTLILGDTGTGKEGVARCLAYARFLRLDPGQKRFAGRPGDRFHAVNMAGLPLALADSLLFGHKKGAFTGAMQDAPGAFSLCVPGAFLFLDEIGDLDPAVQVKVLRVLEEGKYTPVGSTKEVAIEGQLVFATQPDKLSRLRRDLRFRVHKHVIHLPSLRARIDDDPNELAFYVRLFAAQEAGPRGALVAERTLSLIAARYPNHKWGGNVRELKGCVANMATQHDYTPPSSFSARTAGRARRRSAPSDERPGSDPSHEAPVSELPPETPAEALAQAMLRGELSMEQLRDGYILHLFRLTRSYRETAKRLGVDRRTVAKVVEAAGMREERRGKKRAKAGGRTQRLPQGESHGTNGSPP